MQTHDADPRLFSMNNSKDPMQFQDSNLTVEYLYQSHDLRQYDASSIVGHIDRNPNPDADATHGFGNGHHADGPSTGTRVSSFGGQMQDSPVEDDEFMPPESWSLRNQTENHDVTFSVGILEHRSGCNSGSSSRDDPGGGTDNAGALGQLDCMVIPADHDSGTSVLRGSGKSL